MLEIVEQLHSGVDNLYQMIDDLSQVLMDYRHLNQPETILNLQDVLDKVMDELKLVIASKKAKITSDFSKLPEIRYNEVYLKSILHNLVSNAMKYNKAGEPPKIHISSEVSEGKRILIVEDQGVGIDLTESGEHIFKMYSQLGSNPEESSRGMGLFIIKNQVEMSGGSIHVESEPGKGARFVVMLYRRVH